MHRCFWIPIFLGALVSGCSGYSSVWLHPQSIPVAEEFPGITETPSYWICSGSSRSTVRQDDHSNLYEVSLDDFDGVHQDTDFSCWAASAQMVLNFLGHHTTQEEIIERVKDDAAVDDPGTGLEIMEALAGDWTHVHLDSGDSAMMAVDLADGWPVVLAINPDADVGHAVVLIGMTVSWQSTFSGSLAIVHEVVIYDPAAGGGRKTWSGEKFAKRLDCAIHMRDFSLASLPGR